MNFNRYLVMEYVCEVCTYHNAISICLSLFLQYVVVGYYINGLYCDSNLIPKASWKCKNYPKSYNKPNIFYYTRCGKQNTPFSLPRLDIWYVNTVTRGSTLSKLRIIINLALIPY